MSATVAPIPSRPMSHRRIAGARLRELLPGVLLSTAVAAGAVILERAEAAALGRTWLEALVLAILVGTAVRTAWSPGARWRPGIAFSAKIILEIAIVLLGASLSARTALAGGLALPGGIAAVVVVAIGASYGIGRALGLTHKLAVLVACGNSICGNSAIAAIAPVIGADGDDVSSSIAFTAVLGVAVVLLLPAVPALLGLTHLQYGVLAGMTVYAVPQVLAAAAPLGAVAVQMGTMVKLIRVLMLGPVVLALSLMARAGTPAAARLEIGKLVPWFIVGFLALAGLRSGGLLPPAALAPAAAAANALTVVAMAALGLCTDLKQVARAGARVTVAVVLSLGVLGAISLGLIRLLAIG